jgi:hypothetical protein
VILVLVVHGAPKLHGGEVNGDEPHAFLRPQRDGYLYDRDNLPQDELTIINLYLGDQLLQLDTLLFHPFIAALRLYEDREVLLAR